MTSRLLPPGSAARPVHLAGEGDTAALPEALGSWARATGWKGGAGSVLLAPGADGALASAALGLGAPGAGAAERSLLTGALATGLPAGDWALAAGHGLDPDLAALGFLLGAYRFDRYRSKAADDGPRLALPEGADEARVRLEAAAAALVRDLVNTPANDLGPDGIEAAARALAREYGASVSVTAGDELLSAGFPMIHAVGRASAVAPRLIDIGWGPEDAPRVTLVGKGVAFDTGGLDIKPASGMLLMKKDMGGAANVLGLARIVMGEGLRVRLRVLIPAVENAIAGNAFRPGDVLPSRNGKTVEIGNTDAEGRLILADALSLADEEAPEILVDMATLTGAARVALGPDLPPFFTDDEGFAAELAAAASAVHDPLWRLPLWKPYARNLASKIADVNNVTADGFAGSVTAALFLQGFVARAKTWAHLDVYGWRPQAGPTGPAGGEAQGIRALARVLRARYPAS
ncbi:leucyl aminopeptidase family protein [Aureimonas flava]|uniref:Leucyl aminopeptidase family protein n=1 Tax=Aureimonas flava TaxID=2320271 RepID=A0A3A1WM74_9HYPH|nr:leucyl aminopeptidase family protein [Aureimonas flava]RIY00961.1 leucyl aminopeptidase family protein [Aureimonas flava]